MIEDLPKCLCGKPLLISQFYFDKHQTFKCTCGQGYNKADIQNLCNPNNNTLNNINNISSMQNEIRKELAEVEIAPGTPKVLIPRPCDIERTQKEINDRKAELAAFKSPPTGPTLETTNALLKLLLEENIRIHEELLHHKELFSSIEQYLSTETTTKSYFELRTATSVASPNTFNLNGTVVPYDQDDITNGIIPGYDSIDVNNLLHGRNAEILWMVNDGPDNLFVRSSVDGKSFSPEFLMIVGERRTINQVYEIRFRSPTAGVFLRASEREIMPPYITLVSNTSQVTTSTTQSTTGLTTPNRGNFTARNVAVGAADSTLPDITIPDGFALAIRSNVNNAAGSQIFISRIDATVAVSRTTLNVGDTASLFITNANLVHVAGSIAGLSVDILVEQDT